VLDFFAQPPEFHRLGVVVIAADFKCLLPIRGERMRGERDYRYSLRLRVALKEPRYLPAVHFGKADIHEDQIGTFRSCELESLFAVVGHHYCIAFLCRRRDNISRFISLSSTSRIFGITTLSR